MRIGEFARRAGVSPSAIRFYEKHGLMRVPERHPNGYRSYDADDLRAIQLIDQARSLGFSLRDVERFMSWPAEQRRDKRRLLPILQGKLALLDQHLAAINQQREAITAFMGRITE